MGTPRPAPAPPAHARQRQAPAAAGEPGPAAAWWCSRTCTGSTPRPRPCSTASWTACRPRGSCWPSTTGRSTSTAGEARATPPAPYRSAAPAERDGAAHVAARRDPEPGGADAADCRADGGQPVLHRGERANAGGDGRARRRARRLPPGRCLAAPRRSRPTATAILAARIDRLRPPDKRLLQAASVIGKDVPFALLERIADQDEDALRSGLARLQAAEFLYETQLFPELEYTFKHALTHQVTYGSLLLERRRALHARIVEELERLHEDRLAEHVEALAQHALQGEVWEKAVDYLRQRARRVRPVGQPRGREYLEQALGALHHLPPGAGRTAQDIDLRFLLRNALLPLGDSADLRAPARGGAAGQHGRGRPAARLGVRLPFELLRDPRRPGRGDRVRAARAPARLRHRRSRPADHDPVLPRHRVSLRRRLWGGHRELPGGHHAPGGRPDERFGEPGPPSQLPGPSRAGVWPSWAGSTRRSRWARRRFGMAEAVDQPFTLMHGYFLGIAHLERADLERAIPLLERGLALCRAADLHLWTAEIAADLGYAYALAGRLDDAVPILEIALAEAKATDLRFTYARHTPGGRGLLDRRPRRRGRAPRPPLRSRRPARTSSAGRKRWPSISPRWLPTRLSAEPRFAEALGLASSLGMLPLVAHCHLGLGKLYRRTASARRRRSISARRRRCTARWICASGWSRRRPNLPLSRKAWPEVRSHRPRLHGQFGGQMVLANECVPCRRLHSPPQRSCPTVPPWRRQRVVSAAGVEDRREPSSLCCVRPRSYSRRCTGLAFD